MKLLPASPAVLFGASGASGQSLGDLAKKTAADREKAKTATAAPKEATPAAEGLHGRGPEDAGPDAERRPGSAAGAPVAEATAPAPSKPADTTLMPTQGDPKAEAYWKDRMRGLETRLTADDAQLTAAALAPAGVRGGAERVPARHQRRGLRRSHAKGAGVGDARRSQPPARDRGVRPEPDRRARGRSPPRRRPSRLVALTAVSQRLAGQIGLACVPSAPS
jgi:hypothetical protein